MTLTEIYEIPEYMREGIELYVEKGVRPGNFLQSVISNKLKESVMYADDVNMANLPAYANYFYNHAPVHCWGSEKMMESWIKEKAAEREKKRAGNEK